MHQAGMHHSRPAGMGYLLSLAASERPGSHFARKGGGLGLVQVTAASLGLRLLQL